MLYKIIIYILSNLMVVQLPETMLSRRSSGSMSRRSQSSASSAGSRGSKYSHMSLEDFEAEAQARGYVRQDRPRVNEIASPKRVNCFDGCFGSSSKRNIGSTLQTVEEHCTPLDTPNLTRESAMVTATSTIVISAAQTIPMQSRPPNDPIDPPAQEVVPLGNATQQNNIEASDR